MSDNEIENAKKIMAQNINGLWLLNENKPSEVLNIALDDNKNIDDEIWLDVVGRLNDPKLKDYVRKYVGLKNSADGSATHTNPYLAWFYVAILVGGINFILGMAGQFDDMGWLGNVLGLSILWLPMTVAILDGIVNKETG